MPRNVEIKAKVRDVAKLLQKAEELSNSTGQVIPQEDTFFRIQKGRLKLREFQPSFRPESKMPKGQKINSNSSVYNVKSVFSTFKNGLRSHFPYSGASEFCLDETKCCYVIKHGLSLFVHEDGSGELIFYDRPDSEGPKTSHYRKCQTTESQYLKAVLSEALGVKGVVKKTRKLFMVGQTRVHVDNVEGLGDFMELEVMLNEDQSPEEGEAIAHTLMEDLGVQKEDLLSGAYMDLLLAKTET